MKEISRNQASQMVKKLGVKETRVERRGHALHILSLLANGQVMVLQYDLQKHEKLYFLKLPD